jgi:hypothetical protein
MDQSNKGLQLFGTLLEGLDGLAYRLPLGLAISRPKHRELAAYPPGPRVGGESQVGLLAGSGPLPWVNMSASSLICCAQSELYMEVHNRLCKQR